MHELENSTKPSLFDSKFNAANIQFQFPRTASKGKSCLFRVHETYQMLQPPSSSRTLDDIALTFSVSSQARALQTLGESRIEQQTERSGNRETRKLRAKQEEWLNIPRGRSYSGR